MQAITLDEYRTLPGSNIHYLVDGLLPKPGRILLTGPPKEGKSYLALGLALHVAQGVPFLGRTVHQGRVLYLQFDTPSHIWQDRLCQLANANVPLHGEFYLLHPADTMKAFDIRVDHHRRGLADLVAAVKPDLVIVDVLRKIHNAEENDSTEMKKVFDLLNVVFPDQCVVYIHHTYKLHPDFRPSPSNAGRGSSFTAGEVEASWLLYQNLLTIDSRIDEPCSYRTVRDENTNLWTFPELIETPSLAAQLLELCTAHPEQSHLTLSAMAKQRHGLTRSTYYRMMKNILCCHKSPSTA